MELVQDKQGNVFEALGANQFRKLSTEEVDASGDNPLETFVNSAAVSAAQAWEGVKKLAGDTQAGSNIAQAEKLQQAYGNVNPMSAMAGQVAPAVGVGLATAGAGLLPTMGVEAAMGAAYSPDNPLMGAAVGGALGAVPFAGAAAMRAAPGAVSRVMDAVSGGGLSRPSMLGIAGGQPANATGRVLNVMDGAAPDAAEGRVLAHYLTPDELANIAPITQGDELALKASNQGQHQLAEQLRQREEVLRSDPMFGGRIASVRQEQQGAMTNLLKQELRMPGQENLTPGVLGDLVEAQGARFNQFADQVGSVPLPRTMFAEGGDLADIAANATGPHAGMVNSLIKDIEKMSGTTGELTGQQWQVINTRLGKAEGAAARQGDFGKLSDLGEVRNVMEQAMEGQFAGTAVANDISALRREYAVTKTLMKPGVVDPAGNVNPLAFRNSWVKGNGNRGYRASREDPLSRAANTFAYLTARTVPSSGTAERLLANPGRTALNTAQAAGVGGGIITGLGAVFGN